MRKLLLAVCCCLPFAASVFVGAQSGGQTVNLRLRLVDADTGKGVAGIVRVLGADQKPIELAGLFDRLTGLKKEMPGISWYVVPADGATVALPRAKVEVQALAGLETAVSRQSLDLTGKAPDELALPLTYIFRPEASKLASGNTHLHLRGASLKQADEYLRQIPAADGLRVMFISYLERDKDDATYITNKYPAGALPQFAATGVLFNNGEEHRHNFLGFGEGYGHVMFLNIREFIKPASLGPGITGGGFDDSPLRPGIDNAKNQGGTIIWCHNTLGHEDVLNALTGRMHALNVFDGSRSGKYEENYYRYLNIGLRMPLSTGTDWFVYDFSRVYAEVRGELSVPAWLEAVKAGRCQATNGPLLTLRVDGKTLGDVIDLKEPKKVKIEASAIGRHPLQRLELVQNGRVIKTAMASGKATRKIELQEEVRLDAPAWFALRIDGDTKNEFDKTLFAHTSPVYVNYQGRGVFDVDAARGLLQQVEEGQAAIKSKARFSNPQAATKLLALYDEAARDLQERISARR
jgi:hypothetical protein